MFDIKPDYLGGYRVVSNPMLTKSIARFKSRLPKKRRANKRIKANVVCYRQVPSTEVIIDNNTHTMIMHPFMIDFIAKDPRFAGI